MTDEPTPDQHARHEQAVMLAERQAVGKAFAVVDANGVHPWPGTQDAEQHDSRRSN